VSRPNLLIVMSDQHSPHVLGCSGDPVVRTPRLDALAARGVRFEGTYCAAPLCVPSRMTWLTGRSASDLNCWINDFEDSATPTFAHALSLTGYDTVLCGRMHFEGPDQRHGFTRRLVGDVTGAARDARTPLFEGRIPEHTNGQTWESVRDSGPGRSSYIAYDEAVTRRACAYLGERAKAAEGGPFCLVVGYVLPHNPYICPQELLDEYMDRVTVPAVPPEELEELHPAMKEWRRVRGVDLLSADDLRRARAAYYGLVTMMDGNIGILLDALQENGLAEETVVLYLSDHGEMLGEHGLWWKENFYEASVRVPMLWFWPGAFAQGAEVDAVTSLLDVAPTLLELAGADQLPGARGRSLRPLLEKGRAPEDWPNVAFAEMHPRRLWPAKMVRAGEWKLNHYHGFDRPQLFDLRNDPEERHDLGRSADHAQVRDRLLSLVQKGWDGQRIAELVALQREQVRLVHRWHRAVSPGESEVWRVPEGSNDFGPPPPYDRRRAEEATGTGT
jgi:choline-sulfatase